MRALLIPAAASVLLMSGCDNSEPAPTRQISVRSEAQEQLHQLSEMNRHIALKRAIYDSGYTCRRVTESGYVQEHQNLSMWMASCADNRSWAVFVAPDGSAQVRDCSTMERLGLPACRLSEQPAAAG